MPNAITPQVTATINEVDQTRNRRARVGDSEMGGGFDPATPPFYLAPRRPPRPPPPPLTRLPQAPSSPNGGGRTGAAGVAPALVRARGRRVCRCGNRRHGQDELP